MQLSNSDRIFQISAVVFELITYNTNKQKLNFFLFIVLV